MTLQLGFVGTDGLLIASDQKASFADDPTRTSSLTRKIHWDAGNGIMCAASGTDSVAPHIARELVRQGVSDAAASQAVFDLLQTRVDDLWLKHVPKKYSGEPDRNPGSCLIIGLMRNQNHLWRIYARQTALSGGPYLTKISAGDERNAAKYFLERFYRKVSVEKLALLAAHVILEGGKLNSLGVEELDVLCWRYGEQEPHFFTDSEKGSLLSKSQSLTVKIENLLLCDGSEAKTGS